MFRRKYKRILVAGLGLAALVAPSAALGGGKSYEQIQTEKGQAMNAKYGNAVTALSSKQFIELWNDGGSKLSPEALNQLVVLGQAMNQRYGASHNMSPSAYNALVAKSRALQSRYGGSHNMSQAAYDALVAKSEALNSRYSQRYGPPDGWTAYAEELTRQSQSSNVLLDGRSPDTIDAANSAQSSGAFNPNSPETQARLVAQGYVDGSVVSNDDTRSEVIARAEQAKQLSQNSVDTRSEVIAKTEQAKQLSQSVQTPVDGRSVDTKDAGIQAHTPFVTITKTPGFQWGDFGIGTGVALAAMILLALGMRFLTNRQGRKPKSVATA